MGLKFMTNVAAITSGHFDQLQESATVSPLAKVKITVHMSTCGIAAGARQVMSALVEEISGSDRPDIEVASSSCIGHCKNEPNITVEIGGGEPVIYQKMTPEKMRQVFKEHILGGAVQKDYILNQVFGVWYEIYGPISACSVTKQETPNTKHTRKKAAFLTFYEIINIQ
jgi:NADP-reducing hydrogenase subunit HndB